MTPPIIGPAPRLRLQGRRILITGGASGIGLAAARLCLDEGAKVALIDRDAAGLETAGAALGAPVFAADIADEQQVASAVAGASAALIYLTSQDSSFITGVALAVDGGRTYHRPFQGRPWP